MPSLHECFMGRLWKHPRPEVQLQSRFYEKCPLASCSTTTQRRNGDATFAWLPTLRSHACAPLAFSAWTEALAYDPSRRDRGARRVCRDSSLCMALCMALSTRTCRGIRMRCQGWQNKAGRSRHVFIEFHSACHFGCIRLALAVVVVRNKRRAGSAPSKELVLGHSPRCARSLDHSKRFRAVLCA